MIQNNRQFLLLLDKFYCLDFKQKLFTVYSAKNIIYSIRSSVEDFCSVSKGCVFVILYNSKFMMKNRIFNRIESYFIY